MQYGCIGEHLGHSFSARIHRELDSKPYEICEVAREALGDFMTEADFRGINVTIPYKTDVIPYLSFLSDRAREIGAVNTVVNRDGKLYGYNTDFSGLRDLIRRVGLELSGKKVAVLGTGGTSRTAVAVAREMGARSVLRVSRSGRDGAITYEALREEHRDIEIIINTTPAGMYPSPDAVPVDISTFPTLEGVVDAIYNPLRSELILDARERGIPSEGGLYMLVAQAVHASSLFLGKSYPEGTTDRIYAGLMQEKENFVLIGMPGCGKSTVGKLLAERTGRELVDLDTEIVKAAGKSIPEIFSESGESGFRALETEVIRNFVAQRSSLVIATGGGAILAEENRRMLRRNGRLYFLDRPLCDLLPTDDRPLAGSHEAIRRRYEERYELYCRTADVRVEVRGTPDAVADAVLDDFGRNQ